MKSFLEKLLLKTKEIIWGQQKKKIHNSCDTEFVLVQIIINYIIIQVHEI